MLINYGKKCKKFLKDFMIKMYGKWISLQYFKTNCIKLQLSIEQKSSLNFFFVQFKNEFVSNAYTNQQPMNCIDSVN